jgi:hypothetical protein
MLRPLLLLLPALILAGCPTTEETVDWSCTPDAVATDTLEATVDGAAWDGTWSGGSVTNAGGVNLTFRVDANNTMSMRLLTASTFTDLENYEPADSLVEDNALAFSADDLPLEVALGEAADEGGDVTLFAGSESFNSAHGDGGYIKLTGLVDQVLTGCLFFDAGLQSGGGDTSLTDGSFSATLP